MVSQSVGRIFLLLILLSLFGCNNPEMPYILQTNKIKYSTYADEIGFTLNSPTKSLTEVKTTVEIDGQIKSYAEMDISHLWIVVEHNDGEEPFNYYLNIDSIHFIESFTLPYGEGNYDISIRAPDEQSENQLTYFDVAQFTVVNTDEHIEQVVEYTRYGVENKLEILEIEENDGSLSMKGITMINY